MRRALLDAPTVELSIELRRARGLEKQRCEVELAAGEEREVVFDDDL